MRPLCSDDAVYASLLRSPKISARRGKAYPSSRYSRTVGISDALLAFTYLLMSRHGVVCQLLAPYARIVFKILRAYAIARLVPCGEILTHRDTFNAIVPGLATALNSWFVLVAG